MQFLPLIAHPAGNAPPSIAIEAIALTLVSGAVSFRYRITGDIARIRLPASAPSIRTDGLWNHTCFEAFIRPKGAERYVELNFAPSSAWAAYTFESYRLGMQPLPMPKSPSIQTRTSGNALSVEATVNLKSLRFDSSVGLTAVIEDVDGVVTHWALQHPRAKADFHDAEAWTAAFRRFTAEGRK